MNSAFRQWFFTCETTRQNQDKYLLFMTTAFLVTLMAMFSGIKGIGPSFYVATFLMDVYLRNKLPIGSKFLMSYAIGGLVLLISGTYALLSIIT